MSRKTPIEQASFLEEEYREYVSSTFTLDDPIYHQKFQEELSKVELMKGPYLNKVYPFKSLFTLTEMVEQGKVNKRFLDLPKITKFKLYDHQVNAFEKISNGRSIVVTTGTGSGKTETYLYPIINHILNDPDIDKPGIRAIFLFPMNALVNDQMKRIRDILNEHPQIKYGRYVGDTRDGINPDKERKNMSEFSEIPIPKNELVTREEIRNNPPHLLFTNYSMLEYLLLRPTDSSILDETATSKWQFIVLDEAHTYKGALGIEVSMLLRRLKEKINRNPQFVLTSATLGEKNKSENEIVEFAHNLTGADYSEEDIIFANRVVPDFKPYLEVEPNDYTKIKENLDNPTVFNIISKYIDIDGKDLASSLLELFESDYNVKLLDELIHETTLYRNVFNAFEPKGFSNKNMADLIYLISYVFSEKRALFDIKYHAFTRTVDGCYITLDDNKNLVLNKTLFIGDFKTFELGKCKKCDNVYLVGKIEGNYLHQNNDIDIYENEENSEVSYFIFNENVSTFDTEYLTEYKLCIKCGKIHKASETNPKKCNCGDEFLKSVYKVKRDNSKEKTESNILYNNNITYCPCCRKNANNGIVSTFYLGKDATTAVLTQILLKAIDKDVDVKQVETTNADITLADLLDEKPKQIIDTYVKQLLEFSDGRQQAAFASTFCAYNHERFLRRKLLHDLCKDVEGPIAISSVVQKLEKRIQDNNLFDNDYVKSADGNTKNAWITVLKELLNIDGTRSAEGLGIFAFKPDLSKIFALSPQMLQGYYKTKASIENIDISTLEILLHVMVNTFRNVPAIDYSESNLLYEEKKEEFSYRMFDNYVKLKKVKGEVIYASGGRDISNNVRSVLPVNDSETNLLVEYVCQVLNVNEYDAKKFIEASFLLLANPSIKFIQQGNALETYQIPVGNFKLYGNKSLKWYQCEKCKNLTLYNSHNVCPNCTSHSLVECDPDTVLSSNYYRKEFMTKKVERLVFREHTGQIEARQASLIQKSFIDKEVNVLSCSTTFEMGVDVGSLETVFMRNVPPSPANYIQRAGRAGRGKDSSAFVLTFCGISPHDYTYYLEPEKMISGKINPPSFKLSNEKIVLRHIIDSSLGCYFKYFPNDFGPISRLINNYYNYRNYLNSRPNELNDFVNNFIKDTNLKQYSNFGWLDEVIGVDGIFTYYVNDFNERIKKLEQMKSDAIASGNASAIAECIKEIEKLKDEPIVDALANANIIPKYGFPVNTVKLNVPTDNNKIDLSRDLQIALSEYAPDSEIIADNHKYTSRYVVLPRDKSVTKNYYRYCVGCNRVHYDIDPNNLTICQNCGAENNVPEEYFVVPNRGFRTDGKKSTTRTIKPKKVYSNEVEYIGNGTTETIVDYKGRATMQSNIDDELLVLNTNPFYMCHECGYTIIDNTDPTKKTIKKQHKTGYGDCGCNLLKRIDLGYHFKTDVVKFNLSQNFSKEEMYSFLYAFLNGFSSSFYIERNDINGLVVLESDATYSIVVYDDVPGGAGYVKLLLDKNNLTKILNEALKDVSNCTCDEKTACYNCLKDYKNQKKHKYLKRSYAIGVLKYLLNKK